MHLHVIINNGPTSIKRLTTRQKICKQLIHEKTWEVLEWKWLPWIEVLNQDSPKHTWVGGLRNDWEKIWIIHCHQDLYEILPNLRHMIMSTKNICIIWQRKNPHIVSEVLRQPPFWPTDRLMPCVSWVWCPSLLPLIICPKTDAMKKYDGHYVIHQLGAPWIELVHWNNLQMVRRQLT